jgi:hypothetical protein
MKVISILAFAVLNLAAADSKSQTVSVKIVPEVAVSLQGADSVSVKIRLSEMGKAQLWIADSCSMPLAGSKTIEKSGTFEIPLSTLPGAGRAVCLVSVVDGLTEMVPLLAPRAAAVRQPNDSVYSSI